MSRDFNPERFCGLEEYGTSSPGVGGELKEKPEDFVVKETPVDLEEGGKFLLCKLKKKNMTTLEAINRLSSELNVSTNRIGYAGLKDKRACTTQFVTLEGLSDEDVQLNESRIEVRPVKKVSRPLRTGDLKKNRFRITLRLIGLEADECRKKLETLTEEIKGGVPNYYGLQRFGGDRPITHLVGKRLLQRDFKGAVETYLSKTFPTESEESSKARQKLSEEKNYEDAIDYFPSSLTYEMKLLKKINNIDPSSSSDWKEVFRTFPTNLRRLFIHAYQSYVFNRSLSQLIRGDQMKNFPGKVPGYETRLSSSGFENFLREQLDKDGIQLEDFQFDDLSELSSEGTLRPVLIKPDVTVEEVRSNEENDTKATVSFSLKPGRYATVVMREIMKNSG